MLTRLKEFFFQPNSNSLGLAFRIWWFCSWRAALVLMFLIVVLLPITPLLLGSFGVSQADQLGFIRGICIFLLFPLHIFFLAQALDRRP